MMIMVSAIILIQKMHIIEPLSDVATVACFNDAGWSRLDDLQASRRGHRAIINGDKVYIIG